MDKLSIGSLIQGEAGRDAIHVAVAPVEAAEILIRSQQVSLDPQGRAVAYDGSVAGVLRTLVGLVDPFLKVAAVLPGQRFWLFLEPYTITSLRHEWVHPSFNLTSEPLAAARLGDAITSREWIADLASKMGLTYSDVMDAAARWMVDSEYTIQQGGERWRDVMSEGDNTETFWLHYERVLGRRPSEDERQNFFSCSC